MKPGFGEADYLLYVDGQAVEVGAPEAVFEDPKHPVTKALLKQTFLD